MRIKISLIMLLLFSAAIFSQDKGNKWQPFNYLIGNWKGEGSGKPGEGGGVFSFAFELDSSVVVRESHSEYPAAKDKPLIVHEDLLIIYPGDSVSSFKANYFDNEGHVIHYRVTFKENNEILFTSVKTENAPVFRLSYKAVDKDIVNTKFEMSRDGEHFFTYIQGNSSRVDK